MLHRADPDSLPSLRGCLQFLAAQETGRISVHTFLLMHQTFPNALYPAFELHNCLRKTFMGTTWWYRKQRKFAAVRQQLQLHLDSAEDNENALKTMTLPPIRPSSAAST